MEAQFLNIGALLVKDAGSGAGRVFRSVQIDSWESGLPNWTPHFAELFQKYRGYDPRPYLAALAGWTTGSPQITDRFLYDYRTTLGDAIADNYFGHLSQLEPTQGVVVLDVILGHLLNQFPRDVQDEAPLLVSASKKARKVPVENGPIRAFRSLFIPLFCRIKSNSDVFVGGS